MAAPASRELGPYMRGERLLAALRRVPTEDLEYRGGKGRWRRGWAPDLALRRQLYNDLVDAGAVSEEKVPSEITPAWVEEEVQLLHKAMQVYTQYFESDYISTEADARKHPKAVRYGGPNYFLVLIEPKPVRVIFDWKDRDGTFPAISYVEFDITVLYYMDTFTVRKMTRGKRGFPHGAIDAVMKRMLDRFFRVLSMDTGRVLCLETDEECDIKRLLLR
jgi:hypothetical protein